MANKMKRLLVLLLVILKETGPATACSSSCSLSFCYCRDLGLNSVPQFLPTNISYLTLYSNEITTLRPYEFSRYEALETLDLAANQISEIKSRAFYNMTNLRDLRLFANQLASLQVNMFEGLINLEILNVYHNGMTSIEKGTFNRTPKLRTLDLRNNRISTLAADTFVNLLQFTSLDLSSNRFDTFPVSLLSNLSMLSNLDMENNQIETLPLEAYDILASISTTNLGSNPLQCDCRMLPFKQRMTGSHLFEYQITCAGPGSLQGKSLLHDVDPEDMICELTTVSPSSSTSSPVVQPGDSTSFKTPSMTHGTVTTPGLSAVSVSSPFDTSEKSTSTEPTSSTIPSATHNTDSTPSSISALKTSPSFDQTEMSTSIEPSSYATAFTTHNTDFTPSLSTISTSSPPDIVEKSTSAMLTSSPTLSSTGNTDSSTGLSTVSTSSPSDSAESSQPSTTPRPTSAITESNPGPSLVLFSLPVFLSGLLGAAVGTLLICAILFTIRYICKGRIRKTPSSQGSDLSFTKTNLPVTITISGQVQTGQDRKSLTTSKGEYDDVISPSRLQRSQPGSRLHPCCSEHGYQAPSPSLSSAVSGQILPGLGRNTVVPWEQAQGSEIINPSRRPLPVQRQNQYVPV
ncbi:leucine-rich repeat-containing protein 4-like [Branchiostoma lanceolatum]|uniref:leucine-rich repeat-containing protein 4-like n=1 Tax=Branchiostoma lanceolatum TaxID=7740 RepID=UPI003452B02F